ncbi:hypothetical protein H6H02_12695 [Coleofasciculus sp. FACHB-1120]|nr:hypothetical protein [Coleofasciculus sp. FACHB-1120]MBD2742406.1 hypothetical protein [Coleofasciculus sp. FACHB-1120]
MAEMVGYGCYTSGCQKLPPSLPITPPTDKGDFLAVVGDTEHLPLLDAFKKSAQPGLPLLFTVPVPLKGLMTPDVLRSNHALANATTRLLESDRLESEPSTSSQSAGSNFGQ